MDPHEYPRVLPFAVYFPWCWMHGRQQVNICCIELVIAVGVGRYSFASLVLMFQYRVRFHFSLRETRRLFHNVADFCTLPLHPGIIKPWQQVYTALSLPGVNPLRCIYQLWTFHGSGLTYKRGYHLEGCLWFVSIWTDQLMAIAKHPAGGQHSFIFLCF